MAYIVFESILVNIRSSCGYMKQNMVHLEYIGSTFGFVEYVGSTLGYLGSALLFVAFARALVNIRSTLGVFWKYLRVY